MYKLNLIYNNTIIKFNVDTDDWNNIYNEFGKDLITKAFVQNVSIKNQINKYKCFCDVLVKKKFDCYKIRSSDYLIFLSCFMALVKFNVISPLDIIILKKKKKKTYKPPINLK